MIPKGEYTFKVVSVNIKEMGAKTKNFGKKYLLLKLEIQDEGPAKGGNSYLAIVPWSDFNWMNNIKSFFSDRDIEIYQLENRDEATLVVVSHLILGQIGKGTVKNFTGGTTLDIMMNGRHYDRV